MLKVVGASWQQTRLTTIMLTAVTIIAIFAIFFFEIPFHTDDGNYSATVFWTQNSGFRLEFWGQSKDPNKIKPGVARAYYRPDATNTGWSSLEIEALGDYPDWVKAHAAGLLEGSLCWQLIYWHWLNTVAQACVGRQDFCNDIRDKLNKNTEKMKNEAMEKEKTDKYWHQVKLFYSQLDGLEIGWKYGVHRSRKEKIVDIPHIDFLWMNTVTDLKDLEHKYNVSKEIDPTKPPLSIALLKVLPDSPDKFLLAHSSSGYYNEMLRIHKKYNLSYHTYKGSNETVPGQTLVFTSYPASIHSQDDFYEVSGDNLLTVAGTAIKIYNDSLWDSTDIWNKLLLGPRVVTANRLSSNASEWTKLMGRPNSGTGNKQWIIVDRKPSKMRVWTMEQVPGVVVTADRTDEIMQKGYLASYGVPHSEVLKVLTGHTSMRKDSEQSQLFKQIEQLIEENHSNITDKNGIMEIMRHPILATEGRADVIKVNLKGTKMENHISSDGSLTYQYIPFAHSNATLKSEKHNKTRNNANVEAIRSVMSLLKVDVKNGEKSHKKHGLEKIYNGIIDLKVSKGSQGYEAAAGPPFAQAMAEVAINIEPFQWSRSYYKDTPHVGHADVWQFEPVAPKWVW